MTAQASEKLVIENEMYHLFNEPLEGYLKEKNIKFTALNSACWRGYFGAWELKNNELHLIDFKGFINNEEVDLSFLFPQASSVKAEWFTGRLKIPVGEMIQYIHAGFNSIYPAGLRIEIEEGNISKIILEKYHYKQTTEMNPLFEEEETTFEIIHTETTEVTWSKMIEILTDDNSATSYGIAAMCNF